MCHWLCPRVDAALLLTKARPVAGHLDARGGTILGYQERICYVLPGISVFA